VHVQFLFFWSRVVGTVFGFVLRIWLWRKHRIWIEFGESAILATPRVDHKDLVASREMVRAEGLAGGGRCTSSRAHHDLFASSFAYLADALQISPLSGHVLFKELKYYSANMSVRVVHGHIAWRYWFWRVQEEGDELTLDGENERGGQ
jgi:hypothetical protein